MKKNKPSLDSNRGLTLIQELLTYREIGEEIQSKLKILENLFEEIISVSNNPTSCTDNTSNLHLKIAMRTYELARLWRKDPEFIKSHSDETRQLFYKILRTMSDAYLTQTDKIPESDDDLLIYVNILNKKTYYCLTEDDKTLAEKLLVKAGHLISNIENKTSEEYRATTAKTTAAMDFLYPKKITSDVILANLKDKQLRILAKLYSDYDDPDINLIHMFHDAISCVNMLEKIKNPTDEDMNLKIKSQGFIVTTLITQIDNDIHQFMRDCESVAKTMSNKLIRYLNIAEEILLEKNNHIPKHKLIIIQLLKSYCFMKIGDSINARQSFAFVQENRNVTKGKFSLTKYLDFYNIYLSIFNEIKNFLDSKNPEHSSATQTEEAIPLATSLTNETKQRKRRTRKKKIKSKRQGSNPNRFFQPQPKPYSDEDIIKLLEGHIKTNKVKIGPIIPFDELTNKLTKELLTINDEKCHKLILSINCGLHHAFLYVEQTPNKNPQFFYFDLQESIPKIICDKIVELFPHSKIENVTTPNLEATKKITEKYNLFLKTIKNPQKYDSLLIYFIERYINHRHGELLFQRCKEDLNAFADLEHTAHQDYLSEISHNTTSMNNTPLIC
ncbi:MAG: hypothetical protein AMJ43_04810 [Coxiella sp. DG_40]|nr:MAG: hypothetical protein AMJ43_04810 [Coxiella sp. DG_40]